MIKRTCDCCGTEVDEDFFYPFIPVYFFDTKVDKGCKLSSIAIRKKMVDMCTTCFALYRDKINRLYNDFANKK